MEDRQVINGMVYKIRTGISWRDLPERYGPWKTVYTGFRRYALDGVFTRALQQIQARADTAGDIEWLMQIDSTIVRAHQHAAPPVEKGRHQQDEPDDHTLGRSRGQLTTKIHLACNDNDRPLATLMTPGQRHDSVCARPLLERIRVPRIGLGPLGADPTRSSQTRHPMQLSGQAAAASGVGGGVRKAIVSSYFWRLVRQWWSWPSMRLNRLRRAVW